MLALGDDPGLDPLVDLLGAPAGLLLGQRRFVLVGEQVGRAVDQLADRLAVHPGQLLARVGGERQPPGAALVGVAQHRLGVVGADHAPGRARRRARRSGRARSRGPRSWRRRRTSRSGRGRSRWCRRTGRCAGSRTRAPRGSRRRGAPARSGSPRSPHPPRRPAGALAQVGHAEGDVGRHSPAADLQVVDEEGQGDLVQLVDHERVGEPAREGHQVVGGNGSGDSDTHLCNLPQPRRWTVPAPRGRHRPQVRRGAGRTPACRSRPRCPVPGGSRRADRSAEAVAAGAGAACVGVVDREALLLDRVGEVDRRAARGTGRSSGR